MDWMEAINEAVDSDRLVRSALRMMEVPSPTGQAGQTADRLAAELVEDGFEVERPAGGHPDAPAVVVRWSTGRPGPTLQFDGHLDTVHLPFVPPRVEAGQLRGTGASDMKAGVAAAVEALRVIRQSGVMSSGSVLFTAHDLHEAPWGFGEQLDQLIADGYVGDAILIPESHWTAIHVVGRGAATWKLHLRREGAPVHEVMRPAAEPSVIAAGADLVRRLETLQTELDRRTDPVAGSESVFVGQIHSGEIYNQYPRECWLEGTRRWLPDSDAGQVEATFRELVQTVVESRGVSAQLEYKKVRGAFRLAPTAPFVAIFQQAHKTLSGTELPFGPKPFVDDGNSFSALTGRPAITHGPQAGGQHTSNEWVSVSDLVRVAKVYALTAALFGSDRSD